LGLAYGQCCGPLLAGQAQTQTPAELLRSRYTAIVERNQAYLAWTWHPSTRPADLAVEVQPDWRGLRIVAAVQGGAADGEGMVEFVATALDGSCVYTLHERSRFVREDRGWLYVAGQIIKPGQGPAARGQDRPQRSLPVVRLWQEAQEMLRPLKPEPFRSRTPCVGPALEHAASGKVVRTGQTPSGAPKRDPHPEKRNVNGTSLL